MRDEEAEALRLQREAAAGLRPEDFGQSDEDEEGEGEEEGSSSEEEGEGEPWVKEGTWLGGRMWRPIWVLRITRCCCSLAGTRVLSCLLTISLTVASPCTTGADAAADEEETLGAAAAAAAGGMQVERVAKDLGSLSSEQRLAQPGGAPAQRGGWVLAVGIPLRTGWGCRWGCVRRQFILSALLLLVLAVPRTAWPLMPATLR